jgi:3-oxoacyl-[acyl-carrier protein] reductase
VALVTGASQGLGKAIAAELAAEGARVAISSRSVEKLAKAAAEIGAEPFPHDNADIDAVGELVSAVEASLGAIDIVVTNTGGPPASAEALGHSLEEWKAAYRTLVLAPIELIRRVVPGMRERGFGRIVNVASSTVREPAPALMLSNSHRSATVAALKTLAREVAADGVTVNNVLPGRIATDRLAQLYGSREDAEAAAAAEVPARRLGTPAEFAAAVVFLCSARASYITGVGLLVDGGVTRGV